MSDWLTEYVLNYRYVLLYLNTPSFSEDGSPDSIKYIHVNYDRTPDVVVRRYVGFHPLKTNCRKTFDVRHRKKIPRKILKKILRTLLLVFLGNQSLHCIVLQVVV